MMCVLVVGNYIVYIRNVITVVVLAMLNLLVLLAQATIGPWGSSPQILRLHSGVQTQP